MYAANIPLVAALAVSGVGAFTDLRTGEIPNPLTLGALFAAPFVHFYLARPAGTTLALESAGFAVLGALVCAAVPLLLYRLGGMFGGDVKLLAAVGAICRPVLGIELEFYAFIAASFFALAKMAWDGKLLRTLANSFALAANPFLPQGKRRDVPQEMMTRMRFGPAVFVGAAITAYFHWMRPGVGVP